MRADLQHITRLLDELERLVQDASSVPMNRSKGMVGRSDTLALLQELRESLPEELEEAKRLQRERDSILGSGREEAERVLENARNSAGEMVAESEAYRWAHRRSAENLDRAEKYSEEISKGAESYKEQVMSQIESLFADSLDSASEARQQLEASPEKPDRSDLSDRSERSDDTQPQERQDPVSVHPEDDGHGWRATSA